MRGAQEISQGLRNVLPKAYTHCPMLLAGFDLGFCAEVSESVMVCGVRCAVLRWRVVRPDDVRKRAGVWGEVRRDDMRN
eukprot:96370-Rhodomonas_salina.1